MAAKTILNYIPKDSFVHRLSGATKLTFFLVFTFAAMLTYDTRIMIVMILFSLYLFKLSKIKLSDAKPLFIFMFIFLFFNVIFIYFFNPEYGCKIYDSRTVICHLFGNYYLTYEQLFYEINIYLKYFVTLPIAFIFLSTTDPSELASSLNRVGISYRIAYSVALAFRYIPDIQKDYRNISQAQQARGIELGKKARLAERLKNAISILLPLFLSSLSRIDAISNSMELRSFGQENKRTWYTYQPNSRNDYLALILVTVIFIASTVITYWDGSRWFNPFH